MGGEFRSSDPEHTSSPTVQVEVLFQDMMRRSSHAALTALFRQTGPPSDGYKTSGLIVDIFSHCVSHGLVTSAAGNGKTLLLI
jgi:hypothetical protein